MGSLSKGGQEQRSLQQIQVPPRRVPNCRQRMPNSRHRQPSIRTFRREIHRQLLRPQIQQKNAPDITGATSNELRAFDGNAQGFRLVTRLILNYKGGLNLTTSTLLASIKYPHTLKRGDKEDESRGKCKYGIFTDDAATYKAAAELAGLDPSQDNATGYTVAKRHPISWLVEAADDICNAIIDIEDGYRLGFISRGDVDATMGIIARRNTKYEGDKYTTDEDFVAHLRARAVGQLVKECTDTFIDHTHSIFNFSLHTPIIELTKSHKEVADLRILAKNKLFNNPRALTEELSGHNAILQLLDGLRETVEDPQSITASKVRGIVADVKNWEQLPKERQLRAIVDYVAGCTDEHAKLVARIRP